MSNYKLIKEDTTELSISVADIQPGAMSFNQRPFQGVGSNIAVLVGTGVREATVFTATIRITAETRAGAMTTLATIHDFAADALYLAPADESVFRALQGDGMSLATRDPKPINSFGMEWLVPLILNPRFPRATLVKASSASDYELETKRTLLTVSGIVAPTGDSDGAFSSAFSDAFN